VTRLVDLLRALDAGVDDIAHMVRDPLPDEVIRRMVDAGVGCVPTLAIMDGAGSVVTNLARFVRAGGRVALGNDAGYLPGVRVGMPFHEIDWMRRAGMTPMQILLAATRDAAIVCERENLLGTLQPGRLADVLVVDGDPLENLEALSNVRLVVHGGVVIRTE
jgi:imidazolonepropionase-like amidohydrolase